MTPSCRPVGVPSMWKVAQAYRLVVCWPSGAERDTSWLAVRKSTAMSGMGNHSGATICLSVKVSSLIREIKQKLCFKNFSVDCIATVISGMRYSAIEKKKAKGKGSGGRKLNVIRSLHSDSQT